MAENEKSNLTAFEAGDVKLKIVGEARGGLTPEQARQYLAKPLTPTRGLNVGRTIASEEVVTSG